MAKARAHASTSLCRLADGLEIISRRSNVAAEGLLWLLVGSTILVTFVQVIFRYGLDSSLSSSEELARYLFVWVIFIGTSVATRRRQHIFIEVLIARFPPPMREWAEGLSAVVSMGFFTIFAYLSWLLVLNAWQQYSTALDIRISWVYAAAPIGALLSVLHLLAGLMQRLCGRDRGLHPSIPIGDV